jgi:hypothetical protein
MRSSLIYDVIKLLIFKSNYFTKPHFLKTTFFVLAMRTTWWWSCRVENCPFFQMLHSKSSSNARVARYCATKLHAFTREKFMNRCIHFWTILLLEIYILQIEKILTHDYKYKCITCECVIGYIKRFLMDDGRLDHTLTTLIMKKIIWLRQKLNYLNAKFHPWQELRPQFPFWAAARFPSTQSKHLQYLFI